jgi:hypothetical protein
MILKLFASPLRGEELKVRVILIKNSLTLSFKGREGKYFITLSHLQNYFFLNYELNSKVIPSVNFPGFRYLNK